MGSKVKQKLIDAIADSNLSDEHYQHFLKEVQNAVAKKKVVSEYPKKITDNTKRKLNFDD